MSRHLGLIIGINQYQDTTLQSLQFAENDARALAQWLVNTQGGNWSPPDVQLVQGQHATKQVLEMLISQIFVQKAEPGDVLLLYFAGHAFVDEQTEEGYLVAANSVSNDITSCISLRSLTQQIMKRSAASHVLCILDCFQNKNAWDARRTFLYDSKPLLDATTLRSLQEQQNRLFMCSCRGNSAAPERGERGLGLFMHRLILGLCGPASESTTGNVTLTKLHTYLFNASEEQYRPQLFGQQQSPLILVGSLPESDALASNTGTTFQLQPTGSPLPRSGLNIPTTPRSQFGGGLLKNAAPFATTPAAPVAPVAPAMATQSSTAEPSTSGHMLTSALQQHRQQQAQQLIEQAQHLLQVPDFSNALANVEQARQIDPDNVQALTLQGQLQGATGDFPAALNTIDHLLQLSPNNALGWSMRAVALNNIGQSEAALKAVEHSIELDPNNPETYGIKDNIMTNIAVTQNQQQGYSNVYPQSPSRVPSSTSTRGRALAGDLGLRALGLVLGIIGIVLLIVVHALPAFVGLLFASIGLALICVAATRGAYRVGFASFIITVLMSLIIVGLLGGLYKLGYTKIENQLALHPSLLVPGVFSLAWLVAAAVLPFVLGLVSLLLGFILHARR
jgi:tetratricopeptide (TPR) repeat protein